MRQTFKNVHPIGTQDAKLSQEKDTDNDVAEFTKLDNNSRTHDVFLSVEDMNGKIYTYQTGRFPVTSSKGNRYVMIGYNYDSNTSHAECMKSRSRHELQRAYQKIHDLLKSRGLNPNMYFLDNKCAESFKSYMIDNKKILQLVPPHIHRQNAAKCAIQTFKNHFIVGLASVNKDFPIHVW